MRILNLYAGIGGNRKLWGAEHEITAVEYREDIAAVYRHYFPGDRMIVTDAHQYLLEHYNEYDFIWSSFPCQSHSRARFWRHSTLKEQKYPDLGLYQEIIFLKHYFKGKWIVENVNPFYEALIKPTAEIGRHFVWANFPMSGSFNQSNRQIITEGTVDVWKEIHGFDLSQFKIETRKDQIYRNCVEPALGLYLLRCSMNSVPGPQVSIFQ